MATETATTGGTRTLRIAVVGCAHGELDNIYATIRHLDESENVKIDLLLCCGDFQAVRNESDLNALACPPKYRSMNSFWKYYSGQEVAPCTTVFVGGNHEASNYMWELFYGGWVAPSIYYLGAAGVIQFGGIRIAGLSGIYKPHDYHLGHFERPPYSESEKRSIYHVREYDVHKLMQIVEPIDIFISHDWPRGIAHCGDTQRLLRHKPFLKQEIATNVLGSEPGSKLLKKLRPSYWFSAHLHAKFAAVVHHPTGEKVTKFLALDKCLPGRAFLQVLEIPAADDDSLEITYNKEWLAVTRAYNPLFPLQRNANIRICSDLQVHQQWIENLAAKGGVLVPPPFRPTTPAYDPSKRQQNVFAACHVRNPQTEAFLELLELPYLLDRIPNPVAQPAQQAKDVEDEIPDDIDELEDAVTNHMDDPNEIPLDSDDDEDDKDDAERKVPCQAEVSDPNEIPLAGDE